MRRVQVFGVNEALLDLAAMDPHVQRIFGDAGLPVTWFQQMIQSALVATATGVYHPFGAHAMAALEMTAEQAGVELADDDREAVAAEMRQLPAHPEVADALRRLGAAGLRLAALTNSTEEWPGRSWSMPALSTSSSWSCRRTRCAGSSRPPSRTGWRPSGSG